MDEGKVFNYTTKNKNIIEILRLYQINRGNEVAELHNLAVEFGADGIVPTPTGVLGLHYKGRKRVNGMTKGTAKSPQTGTVMGKNGMEATYDDITYFVPKDEEVRKQFCVELENTPFTLRLSMGIPPVASLVKVVSYKQLIVQTVQPLSAKGYKLISQKRFDSLYALAEKNARDAQN